jgi:hypothetical protein
VARIKQLLRIDPVLTPGGTGQFDVLVDGKKIAERGGNFITRKFGAGYPDLNRIVAEIEKLANGPGGQPAKTPPPN